MMTLEGSKNSKRLQVIGLYAASYLTMERQRLASGKSCLPFQFERYGHMEVISNLDGLDSLNHDLATGCCTKPIVLRLSNRLNS
jgi:hypothetical protein